MPVQHPEEKRCNIHDLMRGQGQLLAIDVQQERVNKLLSLKENLKLDALDVLCADIRDLAQVSEPVQADRLLLDVPCTGLGVLAKRADLRWKRTPAELDRMVRLQRELMLAASRMIKPGGMIGV